MKNLICFHGKLKVADVFNAVSMDVSSTSAGSPSVIWKQGAVMALHTAMPSDTVVVDYGVIWISNVSVRTAGP